MALKSIPEIQAEAERLYTEWFAGNISRFQLSAGSYALAGMVKMIREDFDISAQRVRLRMDDKNQRRRGGALLIPMDVTLDEFNKAHTPGKDPQTTLRMIKESAEYKQTQIENMETSQRKSREKHDFFAREMETLPANTPTRKPGPRRLPREGSVSVSVDS